MAFDRVTTTTYKNAKQDDRLAAQMSRDIAMRIAVGDKEAIEMLTDAIAARIEREEGVK